jgi:hypothetical protein
MAAIAVARRLADPTDLLGREIRERLRDSSGLSKEGIELALSEHFETTPSDAEIDTLLASASNAPHCHLVLAANVCTAALRAIACALACAPVVYVKPSRRDPVLAQLLARELENVFLVDDISARAGDELHIYGSDETIEAISHATSDEVIVRAHGTGIGIALMAAPTPALAEALAEDLVPFDGRGCLSPRVALSADPPALGKLLHAALSECGRLIPRGQVNRSELTRYATTMQAVGDFLEGEHHCVAIDAAPQALALPPPQRCIVVAPLSAVALLPPRLVAAVGTDDSQVAAGLAGQFPHARHSPLGLMQKPRLDGPVDRR